MLTCCNNTKSEANSKIDPQSSATTVVAVKSTSTPAVPYNNNKSPDPEMNAESNFKPNFMKSDELLKRINNNEKVYIFDVRGKISYNEGHLKGALDKPLPISAPMVENIPKSAKIITYCGCPHHLSSIGAEQLSKLGYKDVHVLDEGYWYWKDHRYPMDAVKSSISKVTEMVVSGLLMKDNKPLADKDIYLKHMKTGQLEATRTDNKGYYKMTSHIYNYTKNDQFKFFVDDLNKPVQQFSTDKKDNQNVIVNMK